MFVKVGTIRKQQSALVVDLPGYPRPLVIGAAAVQDLLAGRRAEINFIQQLPGREPFVGHAGEARRSTTGRAVNLRIDGKLYTSPLVQVRNVLAGRQQAAVLSTPHDGDRTASALARSICAGLTFGFVDSAAAEGA
ncbi:MAG: hypothetical protein QMD46_07030 [Methanomicrobiales archaeon]|nr:hypothetical protein [Methanomicrobiales archaeon]